jgi:hypothetical protein
MRNLQRAWDRWTGYPPAWKPKAGEALIGFIDGYDVGVTHRRGRQGLVGPLPETQATTGERSV